jgi:sugar phosphate isomerase/epimerase
MAEQLPLSLRCGGLWDGPQPADPQEFLARLPAELERLRGHGAALVEFKVEVCVLDRRYRDSEIWARVADFVRDSGLAGTTVHLPAAWVDLASLDQNVWEGSVRSVEVALRATAPLRPMLAAVHPASDATGEWIRTLPEAHRPAAIWLAIERVVDGLRRLRDLQEAGPLALENLEGAGCDLIALAAERAGVGVCLDVGHVISNGEEPLKALEVAAPRLRGVHLHDAKPPSVAGGKGKAHLPLGLGGLDLEALVDALHTRRFEGPIVLEVQEDFSESASRFLGTARSTT